MGRPELRRWYRKRLVKAVILGSIVLFTVLVIFGFLIYSLAQWVPGLIPMEWLQQLAIIAIGVVSVIVIYFTAGPLALLFVGLYLSQVGDWDELRQALPKRLPEFKGKTSVVKDVANTLALGILVFVVSIFALIPILSFLSLVAAGYSIGRDWCWTADSMIPEAERKPIGASYALGLGLIPALVASIPILGTALLPIIQVASMLRYAKAQ